jgi:hypothetical protein
MHAVALDEAQLLEDQIFVHYPTCFMFLSKKQKLTLLQAVSVVANRCAEGINQSPLSVRGPV